MSTSYTYYTSYSDEDVFTRQSSNCVVDEETGKVLHSPETPEERQAEDRDEVDEVIEEGIENAIFSYKKAQKKAVERYNNSSSKKWRKTRLCWYTYCSTDFWGNFCSFYKGKRSTKDKIVMFFSGFLFLASIVGICIG